LRAPASAKPKFRADRWALASDSGRIAVALEKPVEGGDDLVPGKELVTLELGEGPLGGEGGSALPAAAADAAGGAWARASSGSRPLPDYGRGAAWPRRQQRFQRLDLFGEPGLIIPGGIGQPEGVCLLSPFDRMSDQSSAPESLAAIRSSQSS